MLEQKDLKMIKDIVENVVQNSEDRSEERRVGKECYS